MIPVETAPTGILDRRYGRTLTGGQAYGTKKQADNALLYRK
jgi:hypothetical protein